MSSEASCCNEAIGKSSGSPAARTLGTAPTDDGTPKPSDIQEMDQNENIEPVTERDLGWEGSTWSEDDVGVVNLL